jgi:hypothetical protein
MKTKTATVISVIFLFLSINSFAQQTVTSLLKKVQLSTVLITVYDIQGNQTGQGSGFFINKKGEIITNCHVIKDASSIIVKTATGAMYKVKGVISKDEKRDIAKIVLEAKDVSFPYLNLSLTIPEVGDRVFVVGSPYGLESTVSDGLVSALREIPDVGSIIQISAPISPGSSGSPVIDLNGQVVGIASFQFIKGQNLNFAISAMYVTKLPSVGNTLIIPVGKKYLSKINPEVQLQDNGWIKIVNQFVGESSNKTLRPLGFKELTVKIQFLKPCKATRLKFDISEKFMDKRPLSPEEQAFFLLKLGVVTSKNDEERIKFYKIYEKYCKQNGIDAFEFYLDVAVPKFRCDYRIKVFVTFFAKDGCEIETDSAIPFAMLIDSSSNKRKTEMLPGEKTYVTFIVPGNAVSWYIWVPK